MEQNFADISDLFCTICSILLYSGTKEGNETMAKARYPEAESSMLELKSTFPKNDQIIKTMIAFCNHHGGKLIIGVEDDRTIIGIDQKELDNALQGIEKAVYEASFPSIIPRVSLQRIADKELLILEVSSGMSKPYYRKSEGIEKGTYIRVGRNTVRATLETIEELRWHTAGIHFESLPVHRATINDLDKKLFTVFLEKRKNDGNSEFSIECLNAYGLMATEHTHHYPTIAGILLFGKNPQKYLSEAMCICTHFQGTTGREVIATVDCEGDLFRQFNTAYDFILTRMTSAFTVEDARRTEKLEIPKKAVREALLNAFIHRNYHIQAPIKVAVWADRIEIFSPGAFPGPIDVNNLRTGRSYIRNPSICKAFREAGYIEKLGSGFIVMLDSYQAYHLPAPQVVDGGDYVKCMLSRPASYQKYQEVEDLQFRILQFFQAHHELSIKELIKALGTPRTTLHRALTTLLKAGILERFGQTQAVKYRLKNSP